MILVQNSTIFFKEELIAILLKLFYRIGTEGTLPNLFYEATATLILKPHKTQQRKTHRLFSLINTDAKILSKYL